MNDYEKAMITSTLIREAYEFWRPKGDKLALARFLNDLLAITPTEPTFTLQTEERGITL
jgi:hypothetical protein